MELINTSQILSLSCMVTVIEAYIYIKLMDHLCKKGQNYLVFD